MADQHLIAEYNEILMSKNKDKEIIRQRLILKINLKPNYYRYYRERKSKDFFIDLIKNAK